MTITLSPIFAALGYTEPQQQRALVKLLQAAHAFGDVQGVGEMLTDKQADAILKHVTFNSYEQAAELLHQITQEHLIMRAHGVERHDCDEPIAFKQHRDELLTALRDAGMIETIKPKLTHYDHVLLPGAMEGEVRGRFEQLKQLWEQGVRFDKIHLLGSERMLHAGHEQSAGNIGADRDTICNEMQMMETHYFAQSAAWPKDMQKVRVFEVNTYKKDEGKRANTRDTIVSWKKTNPSAGDVLVVSSQPYAHYQDAAVKSVLPAEYKVETVSGVAPQDIKISVALDTLARQIDVGFPQLLEKLKNPQKAIPTPLIGIDPATIKVDAATYQFRSGGDANGVTDKGRYYADHWDPILHGDPIMVHERLDGSMYVADGHHRVELAKELNTKGTGPGNILAMVLSEKQGYTAKDAKIIAAYKNIAHGQTDVVDTARVFKEAAGGGVNTGLLPQLNMDKGNLRIAYSMSKLTDANLDMVARGDIEPAIAAKLADMVPNDAVKQESVMQIIYKKLHQEYKSPETNASVLSLTIAPKPVQQQFSTKFVDNLKLGRSKVMHPGSPSIC